MKLAYADPPYPGQAQKHYRNDPSGIPAQEVDHKALIEMLLETYDGWALSTSEPGIEIIKDLFPKGFFKENGIRIGAWVKPFCSWKPTHRVQYTWEPVLYLPPNQKGSKGIPSTRDHLVTPCKNQEECIWLQNDPGVAIKANITTRKGTHGAKPEAFCRWILNVLNYVPGRDTVDDLFPGSGALGETIKKVDAEFLEIATKPGGTYNV